MKKAQYFETLLVQSTINIIVSTFFVCCVLAWFLNRLIPFESNLTSLISADELWRGHRTEGEKGVRSH